MVVLRPLAIGLTEETHWAAAVAMAVMASVVAAIRVVMAARQGLVMMSVAVERVKEAEEGMVVVGTTVGLAVALVEVVEAEVAEAEVA